MKQFFTIYRNHLRYLRTRRRLRRLARKLQDAEQLAARSDGAEFASTLCAVARDLRSEIIDILTDA